MNYIKRGIKAFLLLKKNPLLFIPDMVFLLIMFILAIIFLKLSGFPNILEQTPDFAQFAEIIKQNLTKISFLLLFFVSIIFLISIQLSSMKFNIVKDIIQEKRVNLKKSFSKGLEYYTKVLSIKLLVFLILLLPVVIVVVLSSLISSTTMKLILLLLLIIMWLIIAVLLFYRFPILFLTNIKKPITILKESYNKVSRNIGYTILTILTMAVIYIITIIISTILNLFVVMDTTVLITITNSLISIIKLIINLAASLTVLIYLFLSFKEIPS